jgi:hypothetical protein
MAPGFQERHPMDGLRNAGDALQLEGIAALAVHEISAAGEKRLKAKP